MYHLFRRRGLRLRDFFCPDSIPYFSRSKYRLALPWDNHHPAYAVTITGDTAQNIPDYFELLEKVTYQIANLYFAGFHTVITGTIEGFDTVVLEAIDTLKSTKLLPHLRLIVITTDSHFWHYSKERKKDIKKSADYFVNLSRKLPQADYSDRHRWMLANSSHLIYYRNSDKGRDLVTEDITALAHEYHIPCGNIHNFTLLQNILRLSDGSGRMLKDIHDYSGRAFIHIDQYSDHEKE